MRKANSKSFRAGHDPRRHVFSRAECRRGGRKGFQRAVQAHPEMVEWLTLHVIASCRALRRERHRKVASIAYLGVT